MGKNYLEILNYFLAKIQNIFLMFHTVVNVSSLSVNEFNYPKQIHLVSTVQPANIKPIECVALLGFLREVRGPAIFTEASMVFSDLLTIPPSTFEPINYSLLSK